MRKYNWVPSPEDTRDLPFSAAPPSVAVALPPSVDLRALCSPVVNQGQEGSCTANATVSGAFEFMELRELKLAADALQNFEFDPTLFVRGSRQFNYYCSRALRGWQGSDSGAFLRDVVKVLAKIGCARETLWPYDTHLLSVKPAAVAYADAVHHRITSYFSLQTLQDMKQCLADGFPFVFGFTVFASFESDAVAKTGIVPMPHTGEQALGGHAICAVGYDDATQRLIVRNSWGTAWGDQGYFYMPYELATQYGSDFWTIRR